MEFFSEFSFGPEDNLQKNLIDFLHKGRVVLQKNFRTLEESF